MKRNILILVFVLMGVMLFQITQGQTHGKWVISTSFVGHLGDVYELTFADNAIAYNSLGLQAVDMPTEFSAGGYSYNYNTDFYVVGHFLCYGTTASRWLNAGYDLYSDFQIIKKPQSNDEYYSFFSYKVHHEQSDFAYNIITYDDATGIATPSTENLLREFDQGYAAFAITDEINNQRYLYASSRDQGWSTT